MPSGARKSRRLGYESGGRAAALHNATAASIIASSASSSGDSVGMSGGATVIVAVLESLEGLVSLFVLLTVAVLERMVTVEGSVTTMVIVAVALGASVPTAQVTVEVPLQLPWVDVAELSAVPAGRGSLTVTPMAVAGPL